MSRNPLISDLSVNAIAKLLKRCRYYCDYPQGETEYPAAIARTYGKGKVIYIPGEFFRLYHEKGFLKYSQFFKQSVEWFVNSRMPIITDLPDTVELTITNKKKSHKIIHLINCSFDRTRPIKQIIPVTGKYIKLKANKSYGKAVDITTGRDLRVRKENGYVKINLPVLTGYNVIVVRNSLPQERRLKPAATQSYNE